MFWIGSGILLPVANRRGVRRGEKHLCRWNYLRKLNRCDPVGSSPPVSCHIEGEFHGCFGPHVLKPSREDSRIDKFRHFLRIGVCGGGDLTCLRSITHSARTGLEIIVRLQAEATIQKIPGESRGQSPRLQDSKIPSW